MAASAICLPSDHQSLPYVQENILQYYPDIMAVGLQGRLQMLKQTV
jgi:hypothetical protein